MKIGIVGSGIVAQTLGGKLLDKEHEVMISSRDPDKEKESYLGKLPSAKDWAKEKGGVAYAGTFKEAIEFGEIIINCTLGIASLDALSSGKENLNGKILIDIANPLDFSKGMPPSLAFGINDSLGERIQKAFPQAKVIKTLNTVNAQVMIEPGIISKDHTMFIAGNDDNAKMWVAKNILKDFGWKDIIDLGDITSSRMMEAYVLLWVKLLGIFGNPNFNINVVRSNRK